MKENETKNPLIELYRILAAIVIMFHHSERLGGSRIAIGGWIFVEFFFVLSGYFMTKHYNNPKMEYDCPEREALTYTSKKLLRILPYAGLGIIISAVVLLGSGEIPIQEGGDLLLEIPAHFLFLKGLGLAHFDLNSPLWFVSSIMIAMPILVVLLLRFKQFYKYIASWLIPIIIYSIITVLFGSIQYWGNYWQVNCLLRGFSGLLLGSLTYYISESLKTRNLTPTMCKVLSALEALLFVALLFFSFIKDCLDESIPCILLIVAMLTLSFSGKDLIRQNIPAWVNLLGKMSMPLFCLHSPVYQFVRWAFAELSFGLRLLLGFGISMLLSVVLLLFADRFTRKPLQHS